MTAQSEGLFGMPQQGGAPAEYEQIAPQQSTHQHGVTHPALVQQVAATEPVDNLEDFEDYWGFEEFHTFVMPDGKQTITFKTLTEGDIALFNKMLRRDVVVEKRTGDARFRMDQSEERRALILVAVTGWTMRRRHSRTGQWEMAPFSSGNLGSEVDKWLQKANPAIVADLEAEIRKANPVLMPATAETVEAIDKQIDELMQQRREIEARRRGEDSSATR